MCGSCVCSRYMTFNIWACGFGEWERGVYICAWRVFRSPSHHIYIHRTCGEGVLRRARVLEGEAANHPAVALCIHS